MKTPRLGQVQKLAHVKEVMKPDWKPGSVTRSLCLMSLPHTPACTQTWPQPSAVPTPTKPRAMGLFSQHGAPRYLKYVAQLPAAKTR